MTDKDCLIIQSMAIGHLLRCSFDDFSMSALDLANTIKNSFEEVMGMTENIHKDCENYSPSKDYCLKFFEEKVSEKYKVCKEYSEFNDKTLQQKWSN